MTFLLYSPITATLRHMFKYLKKYIFLGCYLRMWFCKYGFKFFCVTKMKKLKSMSYHGGGSRYMNTKLLTSHEFFERNNRFFLSNKRPAFIRCTKVA